MHQIRKLELFSCPGLSPTAAVHDHLAQRDVLSISTAKSACDISHWPVTYNMFEKRSDY